MAADACVMAFALPTAMFAIVDIPAVSAERLPLHHSTVREDGVPVSTILMKPTKSPYSFDNRITVCWRNGGGLLVLAARVAAAVQPQAVKTRWMVVRRLSSTRRSCRAGDFLSLDCLRPMTLRRRHAGCHVHARKNPG